MTRQQPLDKKSAADRRRHYIQWMIAVGLVLFVGCSPTKAPVRGRVALDGQPLHEAIIMFIPLEAGTKKTGAPIEHGSYEVAEINGLTPGKYRVEVIDNMPLELAHRPPAELNALLQTRRVIPPRYSQDSPLFAEIGPAASQNLQELNFSLESNPAR
jgi:hypothetical protein